MLVEISALESKTEQERDFFTTVPPHRNFVTRHETGALGIFGNTSII